MRIFMNRYGSPISTITLESTNHPQSLEDLLEDFDYTISGALITVEGRYGVRISFGPDPIPDKLGHLIKEEGSFRVESSSAMKKLKFCNGKADEPAALQITLERY